LNQRNGMKKLLYVLLPQRAYLMTLHRFFYFLYDLSVLKNKEAFKFHYFVQRIIRPDEQNTTERTQEVQMVNTADFFRTFERIDYIKCDIEGHEWEVFQLLGNVLQDKRPIVQLEIDPKNEQHLFNFFSEINYVRCGLDGLVCKLETDKHFGGDYLFVPTEKQNLMTKWNA